MRATLKIASAFVLVGLAFGAAPAAHAGCKRFGFTVNDYGKEGPIRDAKALLDKHIASWTTQQGIKDYTVGKKDVSCELFLNFVVFDEHTCTATANVCWGADHAAAGGSGPPPAPVRKAAAESAPEKPAATKEASKKPHRPIASEITLDGRDVGQPTVPATEETETAAAPADAPAADKEKAIEESGSPAAEGTPTPDTVTAAREEKPLRMIAPAQPGTPVQSEQTAPVVPRVTETGTLPSDSAPATAEKPEPEAPVATLTPAAPAEEHSAATEAAAAAAAAAERAAAAAETAAAAAKEAAAAAIAAGAVGRSAIVPPLDAAPDKSASRAKAMSGEN